MKELEEEMSLLKEDLEAADSEVDELEKQLKEVKQSNPMLLTRERVIQHMRTLMTSALHTIQLTTPTIADLEDLMIYEIKTTISLKIACSIDKKQVSHRQILSEIEAFDNIELRVFDEKDRWSVIVDGYMFFLGMVGSTDNQYLCVYSRDPRHTSIVSSLLLLSWLNGRKLS